MFEDFVYSWHRTAGPSEKKHRRLSGDCEIYVIDHLAETKFYGKEYLKIILLATIIAWPLGWLMMKQFLNAFAYRTDLSIWIFLGVALFIGLLAVLSVGFQAWRSAIKDPANTLRYE